MLKKPKWGLINFDGYLVYVYEKAKSTNDLLMKAGRDGAKMGTVVQVDTQTDGKGSNGRKFYSPNGGLYFSVLIRPGSTVNASTVDGAAPICPNLKPEEYCLITPAVACAVCEGIERYTGLSMKIKWVNDIIYRGKKVAGILTESAVDKKNERYFVIGIGINLFPPQDGFPIDCAPIATSLFDDSSDVVAKTVIRNFILQSLTRHLYQIHRRRFLPDYRHRSILLGKSVTVFPHDGTYPYPATAVGIDDDARLIVKNTSDSLIALSTEEVGVVLNDY